MSKVVKKILNIIIDIIVIFILIVSVLVITLSLTSKSSGLPNFFGYAPLNVQSDSMEPVFSEGDMIISKKAESAKDTYKVGDIVSFLDKINGEDKINTHRIVKIEEDPQTGMQTITTKGDNAPDEDIVRRSNADILAVYTGNKVSGFGNFLDFLRSQKGFFLCILLPMILFFVYEAIRVIMNIMAYNKAKAAELAAEQVANAELTEEQKQRAIAEYLAQQNQNADKSAPQDSEAEVQTPASDEANDPETEEATERADDSFEPGTEVSEPEE